MAVSSVTTPNQLSAVRNPIVIEVAAAPTWAANDSYLIKLFVEWEDGLYSGNWNTIDAEITTPPNSAGRAIFNLSRLLAKHVVVENPIFNTTIAYELSSLCRRFRYTYEEWIDGVYSSDLSSSSYFMNAAGFGYQSGQKMSEWVTNGKFLTHQPRIKRVSAYQPELLYYQKPAGVIGTTTLKVDITHQDGSQTTGITPGISYGGSSFDVIVFPVGYEALGLSAYPDVASWEVYFDSGISEKMKYELDCHCSPVDRFYYFANSLGGWDCLRTTGELTIETDVKAKTSERILSPFYSATEHQFEDFDISNRDYATQYSGHLTRDEAIWLKDILRSPKSYRIGDVLPNPEAEGSLVPIILDRGKTKIIEDNDFRYGLKLKYKEAYNNVGI